MQSDTICLSKATYKIILSKAAEYNCTKAERDASIIDLNIKDKKIAKRNTAIEILSGAVVILSSVIILK